MESLNWSNTMINFWCHHVYTKNILGLNFNYGWWNFGLHGSSRRIIYDSPYDAIKQYMTNSFKLYNIIKLIVPLLNVKQ